ncbi:MAG: hypothetical protein AB7N76_00955 [Planctomycetota bacterium]
MQDPKERPDAEPPEGMLPLEEFEARFGQEEAPVEVEDPDALPTVSDERLRELKEKATKMIEERLKAKRKQRRLMRGGQA